MKKIRILAVVLALLMLPIGVLASCKKSDPGDGNGSTSSTVPEFVTTDPTVVRDNDGKKPGYVMFFNFDVAKNGNLPDVAPYNAFLTAATGKDGYIYVISDDGKKADGQDKSGCLLIQREKSSSEGYVTLSLDSEAELVEEKYILEFDVKLGDSVFGDNGAGVYGVKGSTTQYFVKFKQKNVLDADGMVLYTSDKAEEWVHIAVALDYTNSAYVLYVNGVRCTDTTQFSSQYSAAEAVASYRFAINGTVFSNEYFNIDNLSVINGAEPSLYTDNRYEAKDTFTKKYNLINMSKEGFIELIDSLQNCKDANSQSFAVKDIFKKTPYDTEGLRMDESIGLYILRDTGSAVEEIPVCTEYFVLTGEDNYGGVAGGYTFKKDDVSYKFFATSDMKVTKGELEGTYTVAGSEEECKVTVKFVDGNGIDQFEYFVLVGDNLSVANNEFVVGEGAVVYAKDTGIERDVTEFAMPVLAENETLAIGYKNYKLSQVNEFKGSEISDFDTDKYSHVTFNYYIPQSTVDYQYRIYFDCEKVEDKWHYYSLPFEHATPGFYSIDQDVTSMAKSNTPEWSNFSGIWCLATNGWTNGPKSVTNSEEKKATKFDGFTIYITDLYFSYEGTAIVDGPDMEHADCTHEGTLVPVETPVPADCRIGEHYILRCSVCGASKIDVSKSIGDAIDHDFNEGKVVKVTCTTDGYTLKKCNICKCEVTTDIVKSEDHKNVSSFDGQTGITTYTCTVCGEKSTSKLYQTMLSGLEKEAALSENQTLSTMIAAADTAFANVNLVAAGDKAIGDANISGKNEIFKSGQFEDGTYYMMLKRTDATQNSLFQLRFPKLKPGTDFIYETDIRLGDLGTGGVYPQLFANLRCTIDGVASDPRLFQTTLDGEVYFCDNKETILPLSADKYTNIALAIKCKTGTVDVYIDGVLVFTDVALAKLDYTQATFGYVRSNFMQAGKYGAVAGEAEGSLYFNNILGYNAKVPVCLLGAGEPETTGTMKFVDAEGVEVTSVTAGDTATEIKVDEGQFASKYVTSFKLTAADLADGALLTGVKLDRYFYNQELDLLTVNGDYLYYLDTAICEVSDLAAGVTIKLVCNDSVNATTVFVNGEEVPGGAISYPDGYYAEATSYLKSYVFAAGEYTVENITMTAGLEG